MAFNIEMHNGHYREGVWVKEPCLRLWISGISDDEHEIPLKELAEALKPYLTNDTPNDD